jgi:hypothetical protein
LAWRNPPAGAGLVPGPDPGEGELAKENQTVLAAVVLAVVLVEDMDARRYPAPWPGNSTAMSAIKRPRMIHLRYGFRLAGPAGCSPARAFTGFASGVNRLAGPAFAFSNNMIDAGFNVFASPLLSLDSKWRFG